MILVSHEAVHQFDKQGRKGFEATKQNVSKAKDGIRTFKEKRAAQSLEKQEDIAALVKDEFGEKAEPLYPRIVKYFQIMESYHFVNFINKPEK